MSLKRDIFIYICFNVYQGSQFILFGSMSSYLYLEKWNTIGQPLSLIVVGIGLIIIMYHFLRLGFTSDYKKRYDYINKSEIKTLWTSTIFIIIGLGILANTFYS